jgi:Histidine kinase-, DNA gyrase B-, and HSP90-like ATPase
MQPTKFAFVLNLRTSKMTWSHDPRAAASRKRGARLSLLMADSARQAGCHTAHRAYARHIASPSRSDPYATSDNEPRHERHGRHGGRAWPRNLTIRTRRNAEFDVAEVRVSDSGKGIPEDKLTNIFDAFVTTKPQGTGLGLPIARTIVESYGGTIWAENRHRGAVFSFTIPLAKTHAE